MNIEEARKKVQITKEERNAVARYIEYSHTQMNSIIDFDVVQYIKASRKGWLLEGMDNMSSKSSEEIGNNILAIIEDFTNIYSAMVKNMYENPGPTSLMRGTSDSEARKLRDGTTYDRLISTTTNKNTAMSFGDAHEPAHLRIIAGDAIPFIDVTSFVGEENLNRDEEEYILAPFTKVKSANFRSRYNGYTYYDVELEKPEMRQFEDGEKDKFSDIIKSDFVRILQIGRELESLEDEYEIISRRMQNSRDREDRQYMSERRREIFSKIGNLQSQVSDFSTVIKNYIQGRCAEKEQEYLQAYEICVVEDRKIRDEENRIAEEQRRQAGIKDFSNRAQKFSEDSTKLPGVLYEQYAKLTQEAKKYSDFSKSLGISYNLPIDTTTIEQNLSVVSNNVIEMKRRMNAINVDDKTSIADVEAALTTVIEYNEMIAQAYRNGVRLSETIIDYGNEALDSTKKGIDEKAQELLKNIKLRLLERKKQDIQKRQISFFGRLRGLDKLKAAELEGIRLEMQLLKSGTVNPKTSYSIRDTLSDVRAFSLSELGGQNTEELQEFEGKIKQFFGVDDAVIQDLAIRKLNSHPMIISERRKKERTSEKIAKANKRNENLKIDISRAQYNSQNNSNSIYRYNENNPRRRFQTIISDVAKIMQLPDAQGDEIRVKENTQISTDSYVK